ncbi:MAG TPA: lysoplasmalogenase [Anaerolineales bacterium]|nr:lysoplasmalogenase [Anaerolineales bacterium]
MSFTPLWIALLIAALDWLALFNDWKTVRYFSKPGVLILLIGWMWAVAGLGYPVYLFLLGLVFSLAGDIFLLLPRERFILGLVFFLLANISYTLGFNYRNFPVNLATPILMVLVILPATQLYRRISESLAAGENNRLRLPVLVYTLGISLMVVSALLTLVQPEWRWLTIPSWLVSSGAILFFISDALLAWNRFVSPIPLGHLLVMVTYHLAQIAIAVGVVVNFTLLASQS